MYQAHNAGIEEPEDIYDFVMAARAAGAVPPYLFVFPTDEQVIEFLDSCSPEDIDRFCKRDDIHICLMRDGELYRFNGEIVDDDDLTTVQDEE